MILKGLESEKGVSNAFCGSVGGGGGGGGGGLKPSTTTAKKRGHLNLFLFHGLIPGRMWPPQSSRQYLISVSNPSIRYNPPPPLPVSWVMKYNTYIYLSEANLSIHDLLSMHR
jgi:hypothetical protein